MSDLSSVSDLYLLYSFVSLILIALVIFAMAVTKYLRRCDLEEEEFILVCGWKVYRADPGEGLMAVQLWSHGLPDILIGKPRVDNTGTIWAFFFLILSPQS